MPRTQENSQELLAAIRSAAQGADEADPRSSDGAEKLTDWQSEVETEDSSS